MPTALQLDLPGRADEYSLAAGQITFIGTATTIIRYGGFTLLTDPNFLHAGDHAHLGYGLTSKRLTNPAIEIDDLPPLDLCVLSHLHGDHWDRIADEHLRKDLRIVTTYQAAEALTRRGFTFALGLDHWNRIMMRKGDTWLRLTSLPARHAPGPLNALLPKVMGTMLEWGAREQPTRFRLYISGDTLSGDWLREIARRFPRISLALLHLGGTRIFGVLLSMDAAQGVTALRLIQPEAAIPIHYNDYTVFKSPLDDFLRAAAEAGLETQIHTLAHGATYHFNIATAGR